MTVSDTDTIVLTVSGAIASAILSTVVVTRTKELRYRRILVDLRFDSLLLDTAYDKWIRANLMCSRTAFLSIVEILRTMFDGKIIIEKYSKKHSFPKKVAVLLYFLASQGGYRETSNTFGISVSWTHDIIVNFITIISKHGKRHIRFPQNIDEWMALKTQFYAKKKIPGVVGAIDGTIIPIARPNRFEGFYCRKGYTALNIQAIVDAKSKFMSIDIRPGSWSDKKIYNYSKVGINIASIIPNGSHLIGDGGYTLSPYLMTPYIEREVNGQLLLSRTQKMFNYCLSSTRMVVEAAFGQLKGRFRSLLVPLRMHEIDQHVQVIATCIILHNILLDLQDDTEIELIHNREQTNENGEDSVIQLLPVLLRNIANNKRDSIADLIARESIV